MKQFYIRIENLATREVLEWECRAPRFDCALASVRHHVTEWEWERFPLKTTITEKTEG